MKTRVSRSRFHRSTSSAARKHLGKAGTLSSYNYLAGTPDYVQQDAARYDQVTRADVQRVARTYLGKPKVVLTVVPEGQRQMMLTANGGGQ